MLKSRMRGWGGIAGEGQEWCGGWWGRSRGYGQRWLVFFCAFAHVGGMRQSVLFNTVVILGGIAAFGECILLEGKRKDPPSWCQGNEVNRFIRKGKTLSCQELGIIDFIKI
jgi:hypothetical protein